MRIKIQEGKAIDSAGKEYEILGIKIKKPDSRPAAYYNNQTSFFKAACPDGTTHEAYVESPGKISLL